MRLPFSLVVNVQRDTLDQHATSLWRSDLGTSGGMLADHGVHFLALGWTIREDLQVLVGSRTWDHVGREQSAATLRLGSGVLDITVSAAASSRRTRVELHVAGAAFSWRDQTTRLTVGTRALRQRHTDALSSRAHIDALYLPLYRDLVENLGHRSWRRSRTAEALNVGNALIELLELVPRSYTAPLAALGSVTE
jgi:predicted dehydrogenase